MSKSNDRTMHSSERLEIAARYSDAGQIELEGTHDALLTFASVLVSERPSEERLLAWSGDGAAPYKGFLSNLRVDKNDDAVVIGHNGEMLAISGSLENLTFLAQDIKSLAVGQPKVP